MKSLSPFVLLLLFSCGRKEVAKETATPETFNSIISAAAQQADLMINEVEKLERNEITNASSRPVPVSPRTLKDGNLVLVPSRDWTSGFFPGVLWYLYEANGEPSWMEKARKFTSPIEEEQWNARTHDMGFKVYCSVGNGYRLTGDTTYRNIIIQGAKTLSTRFKPAAGILRSWDHSRDKWHCPVIIDNLMNLELLFEATKLTGDSSFYKIAVSHAITTMRNHYREDYSSYHVVDYDTITGEVLKKNTHQGYSDESAWSRGQAWGLYGYTMCYRETGDSVFLDHAEKIAGFILNHPNLPEDLVPYWDFDAPGIPAEPRDASAASVMASALYELSTYSSKSDYRATADKIMESLSTHYRSPVGENHGFILLHSTGSKPSNSEVDVPIIYADYYFLEALLRKHKLEDIK
ncbi:MAG TPA: glycoside hydrolase family 88 protein [Cyclobacteriaceae bacterium]|nr:glycoside hydrolase family 88 protein [Cyclobacteriaceae bacterium]